MKKVMNFILWLFLGLPMHILCSPIRWYQDILGVPQRLNRFLNFGRTVIGGYSGKLRVGTTHQNKDIIFEGEFNTINDSFQCNLKSCLNKYLGRMRVYDYRVDEEGYLHIKVFTNPELIKKYNETKSEATK